jgi:hypothetical protein
MEFEEEFFMSHSGHWKAYVIASVCLFACLQAQESDGQTLSTADRAVTSGNSGDAVTRKEGYRDLATQEPRRGSARQFPSGFREKALSSEQKRFLAGADEDRAKYADFLKQSDTGLFRLLPAVDYQTSLTVSAEAPDRSLPIRGGGAFYSFGKKTHSFGPWSDLYLEENVLFTEVANLSVGVFTALGDVPLEGVTLQSPGVDYLDKMVIPTSVTEASAFAKRNTAGFQEGDFRYRSSVRALADITYVLRSVGYRRPDFLIAIPGSSVIFTSANVYQGNDVIVAFRIVREEAGGVRTILWKRLKKTSAPQLKRDKQ